MNNFLRNGAVLPSGLLGVSNSAHLEGFKKTFQNPNLKVGIIIKTHEITEDSNATKLVPEYDVMCFEQDTNKGSTVITYKNCPSSSSFGSIADFFEAKLRKMKSKKTKGSTPDLGGQNGAIVLLLCLNGLSDKGIIIGALKHPDRKTTLVDDGPHLEGEYNGINIKVEKDGSTTLTFKGATDNDGKVIDSSQGQTIVSIEKDGSYQTKHKTITQRLDKSGKASLTADDNILNTTKKDFNVTASNNVKIEASKDLSLKCAKLIASASGAANLECQKLSVKSQSEIALSGAQIKLEAQTMANIKATMINLEGMVSLGGQGGQPLLLMSAQILSQTTTGPALGVAISGFTIKVTGQ